MLTFLSTRFCPSGGVVLDLSGSHGKYTKLMAFSTTRIYNFNLYIGTLQTVMSNINVVCVVEPPHVARLYSVLSDMQSKR